MRRAGSLLLDEMASAARGPNALGRQVISGPVGPSLATRCRPAQIVVRDEAGGFGDEARTPPRPKDSASQAAH